MVVAISQLIDIVEDFIEESDWYGRKVLTVGGIIGTSIFKNVVNSVIKTVNRCAWGLRALIISERLMPLLLSRMAREFLIPGNKM